MEKELKNMNEAFAKIAQFTSQKLDEAQKQTQIKQPEDMTFEELKALHREKAGLNNFNREYERNGINSGRLRLTFSQEALERYRRLNHIRIDTPRWVYSEGNG